MELEDLMITVAALLGFISLFKNLVVFTRWIHATFLRKPKNLRKYGSWAVITGPTDGIGKALAFEVASKGLNLVLVGRNPSKLEATSTELRQRYENKIQVKTVVADLAKLSGLEIEAAVASATEGLDVGVVVNNAGVAHGHPFAKYFHEVDDELMGNILRVNVNAVVWVTKGVIGGMLKKKRGAILNIGSGSTVYVSSFPLQTLYASTKAFMAMFSKSMALEYKDHGIHIQCQVPLFTATKMTKLKKRPIFIPSAEKFSRASVQWIGYDRQCNPYWSHAVQGFVFHTFDTISVWCLEHYMKWMRKKGPEQDRHF